MLERNIGSSFTWDELQEAQVVFFQLRLVGELPGTVHAAQMSEVALVYHNVRVPYAKRVPSGDLHVREQVALGAALACQRRHFGGASSWESDAQTGVSDWRYVIYRSSFPRI